MKLDEFLTQNGINHPAFGKRIQVGRSAISKYCSGDRIPRPKIMAKIVEATNGAVTAADFYGAEQNIEQPHSSTDPPE